MIPAEIADTETALYLTALYLLDIKAETIILIQNTE